MGKEIKRPLELKSQVRELFGSDFPTKSSFLFEMRREDKGKPVGAGSDIWKELKEGLPVSEKIALAFTEWIQDYPEQFPGDIVSIVEGKTREHAVLSLFDPVPEGQVHVSYEMPDEAPQDPRTVTPEKETSDPTSRGLLGLMGSFYASVFSMANRKADPFSSERYLDPKSGPAEFEKLCFMEFGYNLLGKNKKATPEQAIAMGRDWAAFGDGAQEKQCRRLISINPEFIKYGLSNEGERVGMTGVFCITDEAYEDTVRGKYPIDGFPDHAIVPSSNNLVLQFFAEDHTKRNLIRQRDARKFLEASMMMQMAILLDASNVQPVRCVSYEVIAGNSQRLRNLGFVRKAEFSDRPGHYPKHKVVVFDPVARGKEKDANIFLRNAWSTYMHIISDAIWSVRRGYDRHSKLLASQPSD